MKIIKQLKQFVDSKLTKRKEQSYEQEKITALLLSSVMAFTPAMPAMAEQSTIIDYVDGTTDSTVETPDVTPTPLPEKKEGWETVDGVKYYYVMVRRLQIR